MKNHAYALLAGLFVIVLCAAAVGMVFWLGGSQTETKPYRIVAHRAVSGLTQSSNVLYLGVPAGQVSDIQLAKNQARTVLINIDVDQNVVVTRSTYAELHFKGVTGASEVELLDSGKSKQRMSTNSAHPARIPLRSSTFGSLLHSGQHTLAQLDHLGTKLNQLVNKKNRARINQMLAHASVATGELVQLERHLNRTARTLPRLSQRMQQTLARIDGLTDHLNKVTISLGRLTRHAIKLTDTGQALGQAALSKSLPQLDRTLRDLRQTSNSIKTLSRHLNSDPQRLLFGPHQSAPGPGEQGHEGQGH